jgi:hypothetical protein
MFGQKAKEIRTEVNINEIVQEAPDQIASKINMMTIEIDKLKQIIEEKEDMLQQFREETGQFESVHHLRAHMMFLTNSLDEKNREVLDLQQGLQSK